MKADNLNPILLDEASLPSFPSLRERNLKTLYGDTKISEYINNDKSPKGSVDEKIRPLVNLINLHPEFVTLSSCSGRVAMFDPAGSCCDDHQLEGSVARGESMTIDESDNTSTTQQQQQTKEVKGTDISGKGRGKWIFVTHDILPDLGEQIIASLKQAGAQRSLQTTTMMDDNSPITFKHEPPLLHIAASSLAAGKKLLHLVKSTCAMRESGLVVTDQRVTVEVRTTGTLLCLPLLVQSDSLQPNEDYLMMLADMANQRMEQNAVLLEKLFCTIQSELFEEILHNHSEEDGDTEFHVSFEPLPSLNLWKCASVAISRQSQSNETSRDDFEVLAFGGQGIGPIISTKAPSCKRWDAIFRLSRENGTWAKSWKRLSISTGADSEAMTLETSAGSFEVKRHTSLGAREGHTACVLSPIPSSSSRDDGVVIFGGRTGGPTSSTNDLFLFKMQGNDEGLIGVPIDVRGSPPIPRFGHAMNALTSKQSDVGTPLLVVSGGYSGEVALSCIHTLSRSIDSDTGKSHFLWDHIADMPNPRCYHTATILQINQGVDELFVFGGMSKPDDPFSSSGKLLYKLPIQREEGVASNEIMISEESDLPESIGSATCSLPNKRGQMLFSGGVQDGDSGHKTNGEAPFHIIHWKLDTKGTALRPERKRYSITGSERELDLGSLAHHNMLNLPCDHGYSAVLVGGGVPSFSFGQSFAR